MKPAILMSGALLLAGALHAQTVTRASVHTDGSEGDGETSFLADLSGDGRYMAFASMATNLVDDDGNGQSDIFLRDRALGTTTLISRSLSGPPGHGHSFDPALSRDGRFVTFSSGAYDLVAGDKNGEFDVFAYDREAGTIERVSVSSAGVEGDGGSWGRTALSDDGRYVAFSSGSTNLVAGDANGFTDIFRRDRQTGQTIRVSVSTAGVEANGGSISPAISGDGRYVAFASSATNLVAGDDNGFVDVFLHDVLAGATERLATTGQSWGVIPSVFLSADGSLVAFLSRSDLTPGDGDGWTDAFVLDRTTDALVRVSLDSADAEVVSANVFVADLSPDGRFVLLNTTEAMVPGDTNGVDDAYLVDRDVDADGVPDEPGRRSVVRASATWSGDHAWGRAYPHGVSDDGALVAFVSVSALVPDDTNGMPDAFVYAPARLATSGVPAAGSPFGFTIAGVAPAEQGHLAFVGLSCSGCAGVLLSVFGELLPITMDPCTVAGLNALAALTAVVDPAGAGATPTFAFPPMAPGTEIVAAAVTFDPGTGDFISLTVPIAFASL